MSSSKPVTVLVVDDQPGVTKVACRMLAASGYSSLAANSGAAALNLIDQNEPIDLAIVDLTMPDEDGLEVIRQIWSRLPALPVAMMSGFDRNGRLSDCDFSEPEEPFLEKPFSSAALMAVVRKLLQQVAPKAGNS